MRERIMPAREDVMRAALTRYAAGERMRILSFLNDALERERLREMDADEEDEVMASWAIDLLPYSRYHIPKPVLVDEDEDTSLSHL
jgi:hypothetical protein